MSPKETRQIDEFAHDRAARFHRVAPARRAVARPHGRGALLLPSDARTDGMFVLSLQRA